MCKWKHSLCIQSAKVKERACSRSLWRALWHMSRTPWCEMLVCLGLEWKDSMSEWHKFLYSTCYNSYWYTNCCLLPAPENKWSAIMYYILYQWFKYELRDYRLKSLFTMYRSYNYKYLMIKRWIKLMVGCSYLRKWRHGRWQWRYWVLRFKLASSSGRLGGWWLVSEKNDEHSLMCFFLTVALGCFGGTLAGDSVW